MTIDEMMDRGLRELFERAPSHGGKRHVCGMCPSERGRRYEANLDESTGEVKVWRDGPYYGWGGYVTWLPEDIRWHL